MLGKLVEHYEKYVGKYYASALIYRNPKRDIRIAFTVATIPAFLGITLYTVLANALVLVIAFTTTFIIILSPLIYALSTAKSYAKELDEEAILVAAGVAALSHDDPTKIADILCSMKYLKSSKEFCEIKRRISSLGYTSTTAYKTRADETPSNNMRIILSTILHHIIVGSGLRETLLRQIPNMLNERVQQYTHAVERIATILISFTMASLLLPVVLLLVSVLDVVTSGNIVPTTSPTIMMMMFYVIAVVSGLSLIFMKRGLHVTMKTTEKVSKILIPLSIVVATLIGLMLSLNASLTNILVQIALITLVLLVVSLVIHFIYRRERGIIYNLHSSVMRFIQDLAEYRRLGYNIQEAIFKLNEENYGPLSYIVKRIKTLVSSGANLSDAIRHNTQYITDWTTRVLLLFLARIISEGDVPTRALASLADLIRNIMSVERIARIEYRMYQVIAIASTPMIIGILFSIIWMILPITLSIVVIPEIIVERLLTVVSLATLLLLVQSWILGAISGKFTEVHVGATMKYAIISLIISTISLIIAMYTSIAPLVSNV